MKTNRILPKLSILAAVLAAGVALGLLQVKPPRADIASPAYQRMMSNIEAWAAEPHPADSAEIEAVRAQLLSEIQGMGLTPVVESEPLTQDDIIDANMWRENTTREEWWERNREMVAEQYGPDITSIEDLMRDSRLEDDGQILLQNIMVKLDAPDTDRGVMLVSHYDSSYGGPGAGDGMVAVAAMMEALREQAENTALRRDLYFLFTDGEEDGLLGAWRFALRHPGFEEQLDFVANFEARGNRGGLLLFETSPNAYPLLHAAVKSGAKPIGFSWMAAIYSMMPNLTDLTVFLREGYKGINFAIAEGVETYHMPTDSYESLDRNSAGQYLGTALAIAGYAASSPMDELGKPSQNAVYFPLLPGVMVLMNVVVSHIFCAVSCALAIFLCVLRARRKELKPSFSLIVMGLLALLSVGSAVFFAAGSYLFYLPLLVMALTGFTAPWPIAHAAAKAVSGVIALLLWVPVLFLLWISLIQPIML